MDEKALLKAAARARQEAYAPYSGFRVGSALLCDDGRVFTGVNVENASYSMTLCAERVAAAKAVSEGCRRFEALAIIADTATPVPMCGACRQFLAEFGPETLVIMANLKGDVRRAKLSDLLPHAFTGEQLPEDR